MESNAQRKPVIPGFCLGSNAEKRPKIGKKEKLALYLPPELRAEVEDYYQEDGSHSLTAFIENAVRFYLSYLDAQDAGIFLPTDIRSCIDGRLWTMRHKPDDHEE